MTRRPYDSTLFRSHARSEIGEQEVGRVHMSHSSGERGASEIASVHRTRQPAVLASEILNLPDLHGFLSLPGQPVAAVQLVHQTLPERGSAFLPRES